MESNYRSLKMDTSEIFEIPEGLTKEIIDDMLLYWEELAEKGRSGFGMYSGLCSHFESYGIEVNVSFFQKYWPENMQHRLWIKPVSGKEGAAKRVQILKEIRLHL